MDSYLQAAIEEAERGWPRAAFRSARCSCIATACWRADTTAACSRAVPCCTAKWTRARAGRQTASVYRECVMATTLSPCAMCSGAILLYGIPHVIVGENRTFMGEEELLRGRGVRVDVVQDERCIRLMTDFIAAHPHLW
jgi:cytosine deaminase